MGFFFFNVTATTEIYTYGHTLSLHDALPISLDLFAALLGGATALMPVFARDILHVGPEGLGWMRAAAATGAATVALWLSFRPLEKNVGVKMLLAVGLYGAMTVAFGV